MVIGIFLFDKILFTKIENDTPLNFHLEKKRNEVPPTLDDQFQKDGKDFIEKGQKIELTYNIESLFKKFISRKIMIILNFSLLDSFVSNRIAKNNIIPTPINPVKI